MRRWLLALAVVSGAWSVAACGDGAASGDVASSDDSNAANAPLDCPWPGPFGVEEADRFQDFEFADCSLEPVTVHELACGQQVTVVSIGAGWCQACIEETVLFAEALEGATGLEVVQVLVQNSLSAPATSVFCSQWVEQYSVPFPVLIDPLFESEVMFEGGQLTLPLTVVLDNQGIVRHRWAGGDPQEAVDAALALLETQ